MSTERISPIAEEMLVSEEIQVEDHVKQQFQIEKILILPKMFQAHVFFNHAYYLHISDLARIRKYTKHTKWKPNGIYLWDGCFVVVFNL